MFNDPYPVEMFRCALIQRDTQAWESVQRTYHKMVLTWLHHHPKSKVASHLVSEDDLVSQAFERLWQATAANQALARNTVVALLEYLQASLNSVLLDTLRVSLLKHEVSVSGAWSVKNFENCSKLWETIRSLLPDAREQRLAYLLYHCGLKPEDIVRGRPHEFSDVQEVCRLRRKILKQLLHNADVMNSWLDNGQLQA